MQVATSLCATMPVTTQPTTTSWPVIPMPMSKHQVQTLFSPGRGQTSSTDGFVSDQVPGETPQDASSHRDRIAPGQSISIPAMARGSTWATTSPFYLIQLTTLQNPLRTKCLTNSVADSPRRCGEAPTLLTDSSH